ncbi:MAG: hypothetical protein A2148_11330 [Chloroflexi bacterium RBG_16_68_14]|nr:MAG: hypothetical protein A2148_11330 [Chloroflexi bacterium RBG_16_68_14]
MNESEPRAGVIHAPRIFVEPDALESEVTRTSHADAGTAGPRLAAGRAKLLVALGLRATYVVGALGLFVLALKLLTSGASGAQSLLERLAADGPVNIFGFGWLGAYVMLSGSPVAATSLGLFSGGAISDLESFTMINGSRFGASFIVLFVGLLYYLRHRRNPDGLYIGVVALLTTFTIYTPSMAIGLVALDQGWFDGVSVGAPPGVASATDETFGVLAERAADALPGLLVFALGGAVLLTSFQLFDRVLPNLDPPSPRLERVLTFFHRPLTMFVVGGLVTLATLSVSISLTLLVPLSLKGVVRRHGIVPYVMGANITTFIDTLFAAVLLDTPRAVTVVVTQMALTAAVSIVVLMVLFRPYQRLVLGLAHRLTASRGAFLAFLAAIFLVPAVLLAV